MFEFQLEGRVEKQNRKRQSMIILEGVKIGPLGFALQLKNWSN